MLTYIALHFILLDFGAIALVALSVYKKHKIKKALSGLERRK